MNDQDNENYNEFYNKVHDALKRYHGDYCVPFDSVETLLDELQNKGLKVVEIPIEDIPVHIPIEEIQKTIPVTLATIKATCGWSEYCDVTGSNHYMLNEFSVDDTEIFYVKESHAKQLNLMK